MQKASGPFAIGEFRRRLILLDGEEGVPSKREIIYSVQLGGWMRADVKAPGGSGYAALWSDAGVPPFRIWRRLALQGMPTKRIRRTFESVTGDLDKALEAAAAGRSVRLLVDVDAGVATVAYGRRRRGEDVGRHVIDLRDVTRVDDARMAVNSTPANQTSTEGENALDIVRTSARPRSSREKSITRGILRALNAMDHCYAVKTHGSAFTKRGEPDIHGAIAGVAFVIEVKRPGEDATPLQKRALAQWKRSGARAGVAHSVTEAVAIARGETITVLHE